LIAEDKLLIADLARGTVVIDAERRLQEWAHLEARSLAGGTGGCDCRSLRSLALGATTGLREIAFLDASTRRGRELDLGFVRLSRPEAVARLLVQSFLGSSERAFWRRQLAAACALSSVVRSTAALVPEGVEAVRAAVAELYSGKTAS
jgi:hypothetical protein